MTTSRSADMATSGPFASLASAQYANLTTFRRNRTPVPTPVWFAERNGVLYVRTGPSAGKVKRIRTTPRVTVAPCTIRGAVTGPEVEGRARLVVRAAEQRPADDALARKYRFQYRPYFALLALVRAIRRAPRSQPCWLAIEPVP